MDRIPCVTKADYRGGYRIHVTFDDNSEKNDRLPTLSEGAGF
jgi:hypothetical protein